MYDLDSSNAILDTNYDVNALSLKKKLSMTRSLKLMREELLPLPPKHSAELRALVK
jgi:predicted metallopeptidase